MARIWRMGWLASLVVLVAAAPARAQTAVLPAVPELKLRWPVAPLAFAFNGAEQRGLGPAPLQLFHTESLWLRGAGLQLLSYASAERAPELDCRLGCASVVQHAFGLEARWRVPVTLPGVTESHAFVRAGQQRALTLPRAASVVLAGLAGSF